MRLFLAGLMLAFIAPAAFASVAFAQAQPTLAPAPAWVVPAEIDASVASDGAAIRSLLMDRQMRFSREGDEYYSRTVFRIQTSQGLGAAGTLTAGWNPETQDLIINKLTVTRGGRVIDVLARQEFVVLRRESNLQYAMLDGVLTATIQPEGLQVGDTIDFATTVRHHDPVMQGRSEDFNVAMWGSPMDRVRIRALWAPGEQMFWKATPDLTVHEGRAGEDTELVMDLRNLPPSRPPARAPARYQYQRVFEVSEFRTWADVSALLAPLYEQASQLAADSELKPEIERIRAASRDPKARAAAALALVQSQTHYVFLGMQLGGLKPAQADRTWARRFGDCKGKTALLLAILRELGVEAEPALVSTDAGDGLDTRLPRVGAFDHILVRAVIAGKVYWLDGTRSGDASLDRIAVPPFHWALPVRRAGAQLEPLVVQPFDAPSVTLSLELDATAGIDVKAPARAEMVMRGDLAISARLSLENAPASELERNLKDYWKDIFSSIEPATVAQAYDPATGELTLTMQGLAEMDWDNGGARAAYEIDGANIGGATDLTRQDAFNADAPFEVAFPYWTSQRTVIRLPDGGRGYFVQGEDVDQTITGAIYRRSTTIRDGVLTMDTSMRSTLSEFPASEAPAASEVLERMGRVRVFVVAPLARRPADGGRVVDENPQTAAAWVTRARARLDAGDRAGARTALDRAIDMQPALDTYILRAIVREDDDHAGRRADAAAALALDANSMMALAMAAAVEERAGAHAAALPFIERALVLRPNDPELLIQRGGVRARAGQTAQALQDFATARTSISGDATALNSLCWAKATTGVALEAALEDCNAALAIAPNSAAILDSRAFVELRLGQLDRAIADYDAALRVAPDQAASLFGRGVARKRSGRGAEAEADLAAARQLAPEIDERFRDYGVEF
jgi:tetratricopeptide (TPR) repeat protein